MFRLLMLAGACWVAYSLGRQQGGDGGRRVAGPGDPTPWKASDPATQRDAQRVPGTAEGSDAEVMMTPGAER